MRTPHLSSGEKAAEWFQPVMALECLEGGACRRVPDRDRLVARCGRHIVRLVATLPTQVAVSRTATPTTSLSRYSKSPSNLYLCSLPTLQQ